MRTVPELGKTTVKDPRGVVTTSASGAFSTAGPSETVSSGRTLISKG
jgi:hypothetical protein